MSFLLLSSLGEIMSKRKPTPEESVKTRGEKNSILLMAERASRTSVVLLLKARDAKIGHLDPKGVMRELELSLREMKVIFGPFVTKRAIHYRVSFDRPFCGQTSRILSHPFNLTPDWENVTCKKCRVRVQRIKIGSGYPKS